jgi:hypothetical protein
MGFFYSQNISKTDQKIAELKAILVDNPSFREHSSIPDFKLQFAELDAVDRQNEAWKRHILQRIINKLKSPWTLESIAQDLGWPETVAYRAFKSQLLAIEPSLQASFDRVDISLANSLAQLKLWTDSLDGVNLDKDQLIKVDWNLTIEAWKTDRNLRLVGSEYTLKSPLDPAYERQFHQVTQKASEALAPLNAELNDLSTVSEYLEQSNQAEQALEATKAQIKASYPDLYNTLGLESKTSFTELVSTLNQQKVELEKSKTAIQKQAKTKLGALIAENRAEAKEKDQTITNMLQLFHAIGFDVINQNKLNTVIATVNINPQQYGLHQSIDFENGSLGFDFDLWYKTISPLEKQAFIQFFNRMLWEPLIDEHIAFGTTTLSPQARMKLQVLNNQPVWFFMNNLNQQTET